MIYNAIDVAEYIIGFCYRAGNPISNLQLQKILYYVQGYSLAVRNQEIFREEILVWQYGPVVKEVYEKYSMYAAMPIENNYSHRLGDEILEKFIRIIAIYKMNIPVWKLVNQTHEEPPWKYTKQVYGMGSVIPKSFIKSYFMTLVEKNG